MRRQITVVRPDVAVSLHDGFSSEARCFLSGALRSITPIRQFANFRNSSEHGGSTPRRELSG